jgi:hypothetical protein
MSARIDIRGYAIVSDDDKIAGPDGLTPASLRNEKDWELYQRAQDDAALVVFARRSHEAEPNDRRHTRLVISREAPGLERRADGWWWDPGRASWRDVAGRALPNGGLVAVCGGQIAFDLFLTIGFDGFHLSHAHGVMLPGGRAVFSACEAGVSAATVLEQHGLTLSERIPLDPAQGVEMHVWERLQ